LASRQLKSRLDPSTVDGTVLWYADKPRHHPPGRHVSSVTAVHILGGGGGGGALHVGLAKQAAIVVNVPLPLCSVKHLPSAGESQLNVGGGGGGGGGGLGGAGGGGGGALHVGSAAHADSLANVPAASALHLPSAGVSQLNLVALGGGGGGGLGGAGGGGGGALHVGSAAHADSLANVPAASALHLPSAGVSQLNLVALGGGGGGGLGGAGGGEGS
jgi:hypothetical protein